MIAEANDIAQEYEYKRLLAQRDGKLYKQTKKQLAIEMAKSRQYNDSYGGKFKHIHILYPVLAMSYIPDYDSLIDYESALGICRYADIMRMWCEGQTHQEIGQIMGKAPSTITKIIKRSLADIRKQWKVC